MIVSSLLLCFLQMTSMRITKISPENCFGRKAVEGNTEAQEICVKIITHDMDSCDANTIFTDFTWAVDNRSYEVHANLLSQKCIFCTHLPLTESLKFLNTLSWNRKAKTAATSGLQPGSIGSVGCKWIVWTESAANPSATPPCDLLPGSHSCVGKGWEGHSVE